MPSVLLTIGGRPVYAEPGAVYFCAGMHVDADGCPRAYHPDDVGLDRLRSAGTDGDWWGLVTDSRGQPIVQGPADPAPGYYVSCTSLVDESRRRTDPRRYIDAAEVPYIALPRRLWKEGGIRLGDVATIVDERSRRVAHAIFADIAGDDEIGEGSIALAEALGLPASPRSGGTARSELHYIVFPGSGDRRPLSREEIAERAAARFARWGGVQRVLARREDIAVA